MVNRAMRLRAAAEREARKPIVFDYTPQPRQIVLHKTACRQIFYGGAAGGGKSHALRNEAIIFCLQNPGIHVYLFRRVLPELESNHIQYVRALPKEFGHYHETRRQFLFTNGSVLHMGYAEQEADIWAYRGREMHVVLVDEASQWTPLQLGVLRAWNRLGGFKPAVAYAHALPRCVFASNPGGPSHTFLKRTFMPPGISPETVFYDEEMKDPTDPEDKGWTTIFIPSRMSDNKYLDRNYAGSFGGLPPEMRKALIEGNWDVVPGAAFEILDQRPDQPLSHICRPFKPPRHWTHFMAIDWGTARPFSIGWYTVSEGAELAEKDGWPRKWLPVGSVIRYREWYGWSGKENEGCRYDAGRVARRILEIEHDADDPPMDFRVGDSAMWAQHDGPSVAEHFMEEGVTLNQSAKDRKMGYAEFRSRLAGNPTYHQDGSKGEYPMFYISSQCQHFWRTIPSLTLDETEPDKGPDTKLEDHVYDEVVYALRRRPYVTTEQDRWMGEVRSAGYRRAMDPYATA